MENLWRAATGQEPNPEDYSGIEFWLNPERSGWLAKQGDYIKTWRRRWFVLKQGAEDLLHKASAFELSTPQSTMFFIADNDKDKEDWINSIGRAIVLGSRSHAASEVIDYHQSQSAAT
ncbi:hypothetical protein P8452_25053 [Trifolium repens]|nr:hypothetical protein P8452_25053 [Trifolium repens]